MAMPITCDLESTIRFEKAKTQRLSEIRERIIKKYIEDFSLTREEAEDYYSMNFEEGLNLSEKMVDAWAAVPDIRKFE